MNKTKIGAGPYLLHAFIAFGFLGLEFAVLFVSVLIDGRGYQNLGNWPVNWYGAVAHWVLTILVWGVGVFIYIKWSKRKGVFDELVSFETKHTFRYCLIALLAVIAFSVISGLTSDASIPQIYREYKGFTRMYGNAALVVLIFQNIYYIFEMLLVFIILAFFQKAGMLITKNDKIPWGSIGLCLTWGMIHFISHPEGAFGVAIWALVPGIMYVLSGRRFWPTYLILLLAFVI